MFNRVTTNYERRYYIDLRYSCKFEEETIIISTSGSEKPLLDRV